MLLPDSMTINKEGIYEIAGLSVKDLVERYGTPLFVYDEDSIREKCRTYRKAFELHSKATEIVYAGKAFICLDICRIIKDEGLSIDVASLGELYIALRAGITPEKIYFHGNNKSEEEIKQALESRLGHIIADSTSELELIKKYAHQLGLRAKILLRVTPGVSANTHEYIQTGQTDSKFGFGINGGIALDTVKKVLDMPELELKGFHFHIGSQIFDLGFFKAGASIVVDFMNQVKKDTGYEADELDCGGGLGIKYLETDEPPAITDYAEAIVGTVREKCSGYGLNIPKIMVEPGRSVVGNSCVTLYTVGTIKEIPGIKTYVCVDGGMSDNIRPMLYGAKYSVIVANKANSPRETKVTISGKHCETGDLLAKDVLIAEPSRNDILMLPATGAYGYAMSSNYNKAQRPAVVMVRNGESRLIVRRETPEDLLYLEMS